MKICVYAISKNEEKFVERFCKSAKDADLILIADTGSSDNTFELAKKCGAQVYQICVSPWRFDKARDAALALIPSDFDICVSLDLDEVLEPGWRAEIERVWRPNTTRLKYGYDWGQGRVFLAEKIHARKGYSWHHPCHEYLRLDPRCQQVIAETSTLLVRHLPDENKSRGSYLELLAMSVKDDPHCSRNAFYFARELYFYGKLDESMAECQRFLALPTALWYHERSYALRILGKCAASKKLNSEAESWYLKAAAEAPLTREPWCELALFYYAQSRWEECYGAAKRALQVIYRELVYTEDPACWGAMPHDLAAISAWNLGLRSVALEQAEEALRLDPADPRLAQNLKIMKEIVSPTNDTEIGWES